MVLSSYFINPWIFLGASLYNYLLEKYGFINARRIFSEAGNMDSEGARELLNDYVNKKEYLISSENYFDKILEQLSLNL